MLLSVLYSAGAAAQVFQRPVTAAYIGLGAYSQQHTDIFSFGTNQASLAGLKKTSAGMFGERRFLVKELSNYIFAAGLPTRSGNFGVRAAYFGFSDYNETQLGLAYARRLGKKADIGAQFNYSSISISSGYGSSSAISFELGGIIHLSEKLNAGIHVTNPVGGKFGKEGEEKLPSAYGFGMGYDVSEKFFAGMEISKEENQAVNVNAGIQYKFIPQLMVRAGVSTATSSGWFGAGLIIKSFRIDITSAYHPRLGITPGLLFLYEFKTNKK